jgi:type II secretory pathway component GspD/PulD (secretin)
VIRIAAFVVAVGIGSGASVAAQDKPSDAAANTATVPLKVQVVIARFDGDKKVSSFPYTLSVNAGRNASLRMGTRVPIMTTTYTPIAAGGPSVNPLSSFQYQDVGTNIDCLTGTLSDGRFRLELGIEDSAVEDAARSGTADHPSFRAFRVSNSLVLRDGQTAQFTSAVDKITGVVTRVEVTLTVVK